MPALFYYEKYPKQCINIAFQQMDCGGVQHETVTCYIEKFILIQYMLGYI